MASVFLLLTRKSSMLGAMPICSTEETYNVTIKGDGWHGKEMFFFCFRRYGGWYKRDPIASLPCQWWPFGLCMSHVGGKPWQDWQTQRTPRIGEFLFSMGWLKCQRFLIFRRFIVDHTCRSLKQMQKRRCIDSKTIKVGTVNVARVE